MIDDQTSSSSRPFSASSAARYLLRTLKEPDKVLWVKLLAAMGSMPGDAPPQMIEIDAVGAIAILLEKRSMMPVLGGIRAGAAFLGQHRGGGVGLFADLLEDPLVPDLGHDAFERDAVGLQEGMEAHDAQADGTFAHGRIAGAGHVIRRVVDEVLQHVVEEAHDVFDEARIVLPFQIGLQVQRRQAADGRAVPRPSLVEARRQGDLAAQVGHLDVEAGQLVVFRDLPVHVIPDRSDRARRSRSGRSKAYGSTGSRALTLRMTAPSLGLVRPHSSSFSTARMKASGSPRRGAGSAPCGSDRRRSAGAFDEFLDLRMAHGHVEAAEPRRSEPC